MWLKVFFFFPEHLSSRETLPPSRCMFHVWLLTWLIVKSNMEEEEKKASEWLTINLCDLKVTSFHTGLKSPLNKYNKRNGLGNEIIDFPLGSKMRRSITFYCVLLMPNLWILFLWRIFMQKFEYFCFYLSVSHFICRVPPPLLNLFLSLCVSRGSEERQLGPPGTSEEGGGGRERPPPESSALRPAAPAHQRSDHRDHSDASGVTWRAHCTERSDF